MADKVPKIPTHAPPSLLDAILGLRKDMTETLSKKRVLEDVDQNAADGNNEGSVVRKQGKPGEEARSSLKTIANMLCAEEKQAEGLLEVV
ncbi:hypothetical protein M427DRAFT_40009 [Gonapodya prolifera JEL478]|uniref:Uncharacterized protein n=1 Tax=Gonapodya prolifera (strain JEL478) TaxID=1344416 RepID=A0A138ZW95_GONPJ|nr:hypothetical protein M427DRAFT_40009 [Gonapodya prolifera JEL478]|eukprot:KXS08771.1 hypothetical protein M427DRAFT_40009 [Gonapodya prolifera JEL478]